MLAAAAVAFAGGGTAFAASQGNGAITGLWSTGSQGGRVELYRCGAAICGKVDDAAPLRANPDQRDVKNPDRKLRERRLKGLVVLRGFAGGPREWTGGPLYDPETGEMRWLFTNPEAGLLRISLKLAEPLAAQQVRAEALFKDHSGQSSNYAIRPAPMKRRVLEGC